MDYDARFCEYGTECQLRYHAVYHHHEGIEVRETQKEAHGHRDTYGHPFKMEALSKRKRERVTKSVVCTNQVS